MVNGGEACDDGNNVDTDACHNDCTLPTCGDGIVGNTPGETCDPPGSTPATPPGNTNLCRPLGPDQCTYCGDGQINDGEQCDDGNHVDTDGCRNDCTLPCSVIIAKTVAPDDGSGGGTACDGVADGPFAENVTVDDTSCVVYQICVTNTGQQVLDGNGVKVSDPVLGTVNFDFGTIAVGAPAVCRLAPGVVSAPTCTGGNPTGTSCVCQQVQGVNTALISSAICGTTNENACTQPGSVCEDTAAVACETCGDGAINKPCETCDTNAFPANAPSSHGPCRTGGECGYRPAARFCGDGIVNGDEQCDDGNDVDTDACRNSCILPICGDSILGNTPGETCDPPGSTPATPPGNTNLCRPLGPDQCTYCGDGIVNGGEQCDDGNHVDTDGCRKQLHPADLRR
jgi:cysteine-rich repeat protein